MEDIFSDFLLYEINSVSLLLRRRICQEFQAHGFEVTFEQWRLLMILSQSPGIIQAELAARTERDRTNITRVLDILVRNGYVERRSSESDRRSYCVYLTDAGAAVTKQLYPIVCGVNEEISASFTPEQTKTMLQALSGLRKALSEQLAQ